MKQHNPVLLEKPAKMKNKTLRDIYVDTSDGGQGFNNDAHRCGAVLCGKECFPYFIIADGMGSSKLSQYAAQITVRRIEDELKEEGEKIRGDQVEETLAKKLIESSILRANRAVIRLNTVSRLHISEIKSTEKNGKTIVDVGFICGNKFYVGHVGDGRIYVIKKDGKIEQITDDDTNAYKLYEDKKISADEVKVHPDNKQVNNLLGDEKIKIQTKSYNLNEIKVIFAATDGLYSLLTEDQIAYCLNWPGSAEDKYKKMMDIVNNPSEIEKIVEKNERYGLSSDNITGLIAIIE